jgi:hypothetical protein
MANPNIVSVSAIYGVTTYLTPSGTSAVSLLNNAASSGKVFKIESLVASNNTSSVATCTVSYYSNATVQGSAPSGGTAYPICTAVSVPANASLVVIEKTNGIYLMENACISVTSGTGSAITYTVSYEDIS